MSMTSELLARLERHYIKPGAPLPGGIFVPEVGRNGLAQSRCDAIYVGFTSTSGRLMVGHELKVSKADWQRELDAPGKADLWHDACHEWWVVAPSADIVDPETLPPGWGLMVPSGRSKTRMQTVVKAARRDDHQPPWWAVRSVMARRDTLRAAAIAAAREKARDDMRRELNKQLAARAPRTDETLTAQQQYDLRVVEAFRQAGIELTAGYGHEPHELGAESLKPLLPLIQKHRSLVRIREQLANRWSGASSIRDAAQRLVDAVDQLGGA